MIIGMEITATAIWLGPMRRDGGKVADIVAQVDYCESYTEEAKQRQLGYAKTLVEAWNTRAASTPPQSDGLRGWQPIETAPISNGHDRFLAYIIGHGCCVCFKTKGGVLISSSSGKQIHAASHWQLLPIAPRPKGEV